MPPLFPGRGVLSPALTVTQSLFMRGGFMAVVKSVVLNPVPVKPK